MLHISAKTWGTEQSEIWRTFPTTLHEIFQTNRYQDKWPWIWKFKGRPYQSGMKTFFTRSHFFHPRCLSDAWRGAFQKISSRHGEPSKKKTLGVNSLSGFKDAMKPNLALKHGDVLIWKPPSQKKPPHAGSLARALGDERVRSGWAHWTVTA